MALKLKYATRGEIPAAWQALYVEREGTWHLDVEAASPPEPSPGPTPQPRRVLPEPAPVSPEKRTLRQVMDAQAASQAMFGVESEVRALARGLGASPQVVNELAQRSRGAFRVIGGVVCPVAADGRTAVRTADGERLLPVAEWTRQQARALAPELFPRPDGAFEEPPLPMRNPFRKKSWNLTEQMRLRKRDPEYAARLKAEAWGEEG
jgi:hypothetical protein